MLIGVIPGVKKRKKKLTVATVATSRHRLPASTLQRCGPLTTPSLLL